MSRAVVPVRRTTATRRRKVVAVTFGTTVVAAASCAALISVLLLLLLPAGPAAGVFVEGFTTTASTTGSTSLVGTVIQPPPPSSSSPPPSHSSSNQIYYNRSYKQQQQQQRRRFAILQSLSSPSSPSSPLPSTIETGNEQEQQEDQLGLSSPDSSLSKFIVVSTTSMSQESSSAVMGDGKTLTGNYVIEMMMASSSSPPPPSSSSKSSAAAATAEVASIEEGVWSLFPLPTKKKNDDDDSSSRSIPDGARAALALMTDFNSKEDQTTTTSHSTTTTAAATTTTVTTTDRQQQQQQPILQLVCQRTEQDKIEVFQRRPPPSCTSKGTVRKDTRNHERKQNHDDNDDDNDVDDEFIRLLQILQIQWMTNTIISSSGKSSTSSSSFTGKDDTTRFWHISFDSSHDVFYDDLSTKKSLQRLFEEGLGLSLSNNDVKIHSDDDDDDDDSDGGEIEWVEMMSSTNQKIAVLPRTFIHKYNILHRGVGIFVTKDRPIKFFSSGSSSSESTFPDLYVHRRVSTKRIFPSLYDMFVGGVSVADEPSYITARREVGEELGLHGNVLPTNSITSWSIHNHDDEATPMLRPEPLFTCLVCTAYNRCLVDLFQYTMSTEHESIEWQEEEVSWGDFVPYEEIVDAAKLSIDRFHKANEWPGGQGYFPPLTSSSSSSSSRSQDTITTERGSKTVESKYESKSWDFVPDGLLVWRAWLEYLNNLS